MLISSLYSYIQLQVYLGRPLVCCIFWVAAKQSLRLGVNIINILFALFVPIIWRQKYKSWNVTIESCSICFRTKNGCVKGWWNWLLSTNRKSTKTSTLITSANIWYNKCLRKWRTNTIFVEKWTAYYSIIILLLLLLKSVTLRYSVRRL